MGYKYGMWELSGFYPGGMYRKPIFTPDMAVATDRDGQQGDERKRLASMNCVYMRNKKWFSFLLSYPCWP